MVAASGLAKEFLILFRAKVKIKNSTRSVYLRLCGIFLDMNNVYAIDNTH